jgi:hypothetical protein
VRTRTTLAILLTAGALLTACSGSNGTDTAARPTGTTAAAEAKIDCSDTALSQADWTANCTGPSADTAGLTKQFGQTYAWPDGVTATVTQARVFTAYDRAGGEKPTGDTDYQVMIKVTNGGHTPFDLSTLSVITAGATTGGEAAATSWSNGAPGLEGRLAPGVTVMKADGEALEKQFGRKIVVTVQRMSAAGDTMAFPEFTGSITG